MAMSPLSSRMSVVGRGFGVAPCRRTRCRRVRPTVALSRASTIRVADVPRLVDDDQTHDLVSFVSRSTQPSSAVTTSGTTNIERERPLVAAEALGDPASDGEDPAKAHRRPPADAPGSRPIERAAFGVEAGRTEERRLEVVRPGLRAQLGAGAASDDLRRPARTGARHTDRPRPSRGSRRGSSCPAGEAPEVGSRTGPAAPGPRQHRT